MATPSERGASGGSRVVLGKALRRAERRLHGWQTNLLATEPEPAGHLSEHEKRLERERVRRLQRFYERVSRTVDKAAGSYNPKTVRKTSGAGQIEKVEKAVAAWGAQDLFFSSLARDEPLDRALVMASRPMIRTGAVDRVRSLAEVLRSRPELASVGNVIGGLVAVEGHLPGMAWEQLAAADREQVLRLAPAEFFRTGFTTEPSVAGEALAEALRDDTVDATSAEWFDIACTSFAAAFEAESRAALSCARAGAEADGDGRLVDRIEWLEGWYGTAEAAKQEVLAPAGTVPFAVLDYKQPDEAFASKNLGDHVQTIASLGHLVRRSGFRFSGETDAVRVANTLQARVKPERVIEGDDAELTLYRVQRDATNHDLVPDGTWMLAFGWYMHRQFGAKFDMPFNPRLRPIFVSFHVNTPAFLTDEVVEYLKRYAPVGCRDWNTVHLLHAAGVPAFFSGCLTTTVDTVFTPDPGATPSGTLYVDTPGTGPGVLWKQTAPEIRRRGFADNVGDAIDVLTSYQREYKTVVTSRLHCYLPARSVGAEVEFRAKNPADVRFDGLVGIDDEAFEQIRRAMLELLQPVIGAIGAGRPEGEVYALWRELTAPAVEAAESVRRSVTDLTEVAFDVAAACRDIRQRSVTIERTEEPSTGEAVAVALSVDGDLKHQLDVTLESIVSGATRPVHAYVLCRGHDDSDFDRVARVFPTLTVTWLPTDDVDYGPILGRPSRALFATLDQLLVPELLQDVSRVVHHDVHALCVGDIAELFDTDLGGSPLAARTSPRADANSGFTNVINTSKRMKSDALARELILRTHTRHPYDFPAFDPTVMVLDLDRMRSDEFCRRFLPWVERFGLDSREVVNTYVGDDRAHLEPRWNRLPHLEIVHDPKIISWTGSQKPWDPAYVQYKDVWDDCAGRVARRNAALGAAATV
ncbi:glycosyltransferase [Aeromicrobium sp.]|uniref:glycosyltransferase n=1 Tax=Aeromicrobium sp. TaxID=1871063 RepID=UPI0030C5A1E4